MINVCRSVGLMLALFAQPMPAAAMELDALIARTLEARGGLERIRAVETLRIEGTRRRVRCKRRFRSS